MSISGLVRRNLFWSVDKLRGGGYNNQYGYLQRSFQNPESFFIHQHKDKLNGILSHAVRSTRWYRNYDGYSSLSDFPVLPKEMIINNYNEFLSSDFQIEQLSVRRTSGSYGTPFAIHFSPEKVKSQWTSILYFNQQSGYQLGEPFLQLRVHAKSSLALRLQNSFMLRPEKISEQWLESARKVLLNKKFHFMVTYPSSLLPVAVYCREKGDGPEKFGFKNMVTSAEILTDNARRVFESVFGAKVHDRYATLETGVLAHQCPECGNFHVNYPNYHIELLKRDCSEPVGPGELGRVVVTDFHSKAVPLIRYDIGDISQWVDPSESCNPYIPTLKMVVGRKDDFVSNETGELVNPVSIFEALAIKDCLNISQYQMVQMDRLYYKLYLVVTDDYKSEAIIRKRLIELLGNSARIEIEYVEEIPPLESGKRPVIINKYDPSINRNDI